MKTIRKIKFLGICLALAFQSISLQAQSIFDYEGITYRVITDADEASTFGTVAVTMKSDGSYEGAITIPNAVKQSDDEYADVYKVVAIDDFAFKGSPTLTKVVLPLTIESIGNNAFEECWQLTCIEIPQGNLTQIGQSAFASSGLKSIRLPEGITELSPNLFAGCTDLEQISLPASLQKISMSVFAHCQSLMTIELPMNLRTIDVMAFYDCGIRNIRLPNRITSIPQGAFQECRRLEQIVLPETLQKIGAVAFHSCQSLKTIELPKSLRDIDMAAFMACGLTKIQLPDKVEVISMSAFSFCFDLEEVILSPNTTTIKTAAFSMCSKLSKINKPETLINIEDNAFASCINLPDDYLPEEPEFLKNMNDEQKEQYKQAMEQSIQQTKSTMWK